MVKPTKDTADDANNNDDGVSPATPTNATTDDLEVLNGLLVRRLIEKISEGIETASDLSTAQHFLKSHKVQVDSEQHHRPHDHAYHGDLGDLDFPVDVDAPDYKDSRSGTAPTTTDEPKWQGLDYPINMEEI